MVWENQRPFVLDRGQWVLVDRGRPEVWVRVWSVSGDGGLWSDVTSTLLGGLLANRAKSVGPPWLVGGDAAEDAG